MLKRTLLNHSILSHDIMKVMLLIIIKLLMCCIICQLGAFERPCNKFDNKVCSPRYQQFNGSIIVKANENHC